MQNSQRRFLITLALAAMFGLASLAGMGPARATYWSLAQSCDVATDTKVSIIKNSQSGETAIRTVSGLGRPRIWVFPAEFTLNSSGFYENSALTVLVSPTNQIEKVYVNKLATEFRCGN